LIFRTKKLTDRFFFFGKTVTLIELLKFFSLFS